MKEKSKTKMFVKTKSAYIFF